MKSIIALAFMFLIINQSLAISIQHELQRKHQRKSHKFPKNKDQAKQRLDSYLKAFAIELEEKINDGGVDVIADENNQALVKCLDGKLQKSFYALDKLPNYKQDNLILDSFMGCFRDFQISIKQTLINEAKKLGKNIAVGAAKTAAEQLAFKSILAVAFVIPIPGTVAIATAGIAVKKFYDWIKTVTANSKSDFIATFVDCHDNDAWYKTASFDQDCGGKGKDGAEYFFNMLTNFGKEELEVASKIKELIVGRRQRLMKNNKKFAKSVKKISALLVKKLNNKKTDI